MRCGGRSILYLSARCPVGFQSSLRRRTEPTPTHSSISGTASRASVFSVHKALQRAKTSLSCSRVKSVGTMCTPISRGRSPSLPERQQVDQTTVKATHLLCDRLHVLRPGRKTCFIRHLPIPTRGPPPPPHCAVSRYARMHDLCRPRRLTSVHLYKSARSFTLQRLCAHLWYLPSHGAHTISAICPIGSLSLPPTILPDPTTL